MICIYCILHTYTYTHTYIYTYIHIYIYTHIHNQTMFNVCKTVNVVEPVVENEDKKIINKVNNALNMLHAKGTKEELTEITHDYAKAVGMDDLNRNLLVTLKTESTETFIKKAFTDPHDPSKQLDYAQMRALYG